MSTSLCRQNLHDECEVALSQQINLELDSGYTFFALASQFARDDIALPGAARFFRMAFHEENEHAEKLMDYLLLRGGRPTFQSIRAPNIDRITTILEAMKLTLEIEKHVNESFFKLHGVAEKHGDQQMMDFLEGEFLKEQVEEIRKLSDYITQLERAGPGLGEYLFDKLTLKEGSC